MAFSHQSAQAHQSSLSTTRLPSIRDLNFAYDPPSQLPPDPASSPSGPIQPSEHRGPPPNQPQRHEWNRQVPPPPQSSSMQMHRSHLSPVVANNHDHSRHEPPFGQPGGNLPLSSQMPPPPPRESESTQKRPRTNAPTVGVSPRSSSHVSRALALSLLPLLFTKGTAVLTLTVSHVLPCPPSILERLSSASFVPFTTPTSAILYCSTTSRTDSAPPNTVPPTLWLSQLSPYCAEGPSTCGISSSTTPSVSIPPCTAFCS